MTSNIAEIQFQREYALTEVPREIVDGIKPREPYSTGAGSYVQYFSYEHLKVNEFVERTLQEIVEDVGSLTVRKFDAQIAEVQSDETTITVPGWFGRKKQLPLTKFTPGNLVVTGTIQYLPQAPEEDAQKQLRSLQSKGYQCTTKTFEQIQNEKIGRLERQVRELAGDTKYDGHDYLA